MKRLLFIFLLLAVSVCAGDFTFTGELTFKTNTNTSPSISVPRWKGYISTLNTDVWYILLYDSLYRSSDAGVTWPGNLLLNPRSYNEHGSIDGAGDSVAISTEGRLWIVNNMTQRTGVIIPNQSVDYSFSNVVIDTAGTDRIFSLSRRSDSYTENIRADYTSDGGATWTRTTPLNGPAYCRMGGFPWIGGHPVAIEFSNGYGANYARWNSSAWVTSADSQIAPGSYWDASLNNRAVTFNGYISGSDTLIFFCWPGLSANNFRCRWKRFQGGTGAWNDVTLSTSANSSRI
jgi:hypothetical protein